MAFKVFYKGLDVFCETPQDVDALATQIAKHTEPETPKRFPRLEGSDVPVAPRSTGQFVRRLNRKQQDLLRQIASGSRSDTELRNALGLKSNKSLAGVLTGISRAAKRAGFQPREIVSRIVTRRDPTGERSYSYSLAQATAQEVRDVLS